MHTVDFRQAPGSARNRPVRDRSETVTRRPSDGSPSSGRAAGPGIIASLVRVPPPISSAASSTVTSTLVLMRSEQCQRTGDSADRGVQRRNEVVDYQRRALAVAKFPGVGSVEDVMTHAAADHRPVAHHVVGEAQHLQAGWHRLEGIAIQWAKHIECGSAPPQQVLAAVLRPADEIGHNGKRQRRSQSRDTVHVLTSHGLRDQLLGLVGYDVSYRAQGPWQGAGARRACAAGRVPRRHC